jgi:hypothetical protein
MNLKFKNIKENPATLLRRAGYVFQRRESEKMSFIRPLARSGYPRFHVFVNFEGTDAVVSLHLDQKKATYGVGTRHHGKYEDEGLLHEEAERIQGYLNQT